MNERIEIINTGESHATTILLNGVDISEIVSEIRFQQKKGEFPTVCLNFVASAVNIRTDWVVDYPEKFFDAFIADKNMTKEQQKRLAKRGKCKKKKAQFGASERAFIIASEQIKKELKS